MPKNSLIVQQTKAWLEQIVIDLQLCPFAEHPYSNDQVQYIVCHETDSEKRLLTLISALAELDTNNEIETSLIIFPDSTLTFDNYLDLLELAHALMNEYDYSGKYQLASFHPDYQFEGTDIDDASNYTNRSPYPMLHCIREDSIEKVLSTYPSPESIPEKNIERTRALGTKHMKKQLDKIMKMTEKLSLNAIPNKNDTL